MSSETPLARRDRVCDEFSQELAEHQADSAHWPAPRIEKFLAQVPELEQCLLLSELMLEELQHRWRRGELPRLDEYKARFPGHDAAVEQAFFTRTDKGGLALRDYQATR